MKRYETRTETKPQTYRDLVSFSCDVCKREATHAKREDWAESGYEVNEVTVKHETGERYPEGTHIDTLCFDLCPECFREHVVEHLKGLGAEPRVEEVDF